MKRFWTWGVLLLLVVALAGPSIASGQGGSQTLAWQVGGTLGRAEGSGTLVWEAADTDPLRLADVPDEGPGTRVFACGSDAVLAAVDEDSAGMMMTFIGAERGGLYSLPLDGASMGGDPVRLGDAHALACVGPGRATFSPDGARWAYIDYPADETRSGAFANGTLRTLAMPDGAETATYDDVVAFALADDALYYVQFFTNTQGLADEAVLTVATGDSTREWVALTPAESCDWTSAALDVSPDGEQVIFSLGEHCPGGSQWRLFSLAGGETPVEHVYMPSGGAFLPASTINQVYYLEDGGHVLAVFPNGRGANIGNLVIVDLENNAVTLVTEGVTVDSAPDGRAQHMQFSPGGRYLAYVSSTANNENFVHRLELDGSFEPVTLSAGPRGDAISAFTWRPDGGLVYVAGGVDGGDNSVFLLPAGATEAQRVARGKFLRDMAEATNEAVTLLDYVEPDDDNREAAADLVLVGFDGSRSVLVNGRDAAATAYPLLMR